ncbi:hypothetical protein J4573_10830 [Actinomadura barringtoniae]|uniref:Uncharacterized protein n=1 Tax=Actinomadura barringtoniae TaxID=1427535 RepID=A0A939P804_9ACTN|nr:DUF6221 family protein [Actinomadura barringtoniae]MBO2447582.1 hypothetical protein [Actinomadura barringtoniae]
MSDLVDFLRARIDKDEALARACAAAPWRALPAGQIVVDSPDSDAAPAPAPVASAENLTYAEHIARHDPARVLRDVETRRRLIAEYEKNAWRASQGRGEQYVDPWETTLRLLAEVYDHHPAYQEAWRPGS